jgi:hypothetical protein
MKLRYLSIAAALLAALVLGGCPGSWVQPAPYQTPSPPYTVTYTYPLDMMKEFPVTGSMIVHFNDDLGQVNPTAAITLNQVDANGAVITAVPFTGSFSGPNVFVVPTVPLAPLSNFVMTVAPTLISQDGVAPAIPADGLVIHFATLAQNPQAGQTLAVTSVLPDPVNDVVYDFHTFRAYFSAPIDRRTVANGTTFMFTNAQGGLIQGSLFVRSAQIVFDPENDLPAGTYTMTLTTGLTGVAGETLAQDAVFTYHVQSTQPHHTLTVENCPTLGTHSSCAPTATPAALPRHPLTGDDTNAMLVDSLLLGPTRTYISGQLTAELGTPPNGDGTRIPMVIRKGQVLYATNIVSELGGFIPTGLQTGESKITVLTDAVGVLSASDYTSAVSGGAPSVSLTLDAALSPASPTAGMLMGQIILGTRLFGTAQVDFATGHLVMNMAGYGEFFVFGERIRTQMSLTMSDPVTVFPYVPDTTPPTLAITSPVGGATRVRLGSALYLLFDKPVTPDSAAATVSLLDDSGSAVAVNMLANGPKIILAPVQPLLPDSMYQLYVTPGLSDINGNKTQTAYTATFQTGAVEWDAEPPIIETTSPGDGARDLVPTVPGQIPIEIWFSQQMDGDTIVLGDSFQVEDVTTGQGVPGTLVYFGARVAFYPNAPFAAGDTIRVTLTDDITSFAGVKLSLLRNHKPGGAPGQNSVSIDFIAAARNRWVPLRLQLDPVVDVDGSGYIDNTETVPSPPVNYFQINSALIKTPSYAAGYMMSYVKGLEFDSNSVPYMDIELIQGITMTATSTQVSLRDALQDQVTDEQWALLEAAEPGIRDSLFSPLGRILIDMLEPGEAPSVESPTHTTQMNISMLTHIMVDNTVMNAMLVHTLPLDAVGQLSFSQDGLMVVAIAGSTTMKMVIHIPIIDIDITLPLPTTVNMRAVSRNPLSWWDTF